MALIAKSGTPSPSNVNFDQSQVISSGSRAGEDIAAGDLVYIASNGSVMRSNGTTLGAAAAKVDGIAAKAADNGEPVTVLRDIEFHYGSGLTPGARLYAGATAGRIDDAATTGGTAPIGFVVDTSRVFIHGSYY